MIDDREASAIWADECGTRRFLLPNDLDLPPGDFPLHTAAGRQRRVDVAALAPFEVSAEETETWAKAELKDVARRLGAGLKEALLGPKRPDADTDAGACAATGEGKDQGRPSATPGLDLLADITATPRDGLTDDYAAIGRALRGYFGDLTATVGDALGGDPARMAAAQARMDQWAQTLREHGVAAPSVPVDPVVEASAAAAARPSSGGSAPGAPDRGVTPGAAGAAGIAERLRQLADDLRRRAESLADARQAAQPGPERAERDT